MEQVLLATETTGREFDSNITFIVFLDIYQDGWFVEYCLKKDNPVQQIWKRWHTHPLQQHGDLSRVVVFGSEKDTLYRLNGGTVGATAFRVFPFRDD